MKIKKKINCLSKNTEEFSQILIDINPLENIQYFQMKVRLSVISSSGPRQT